MRQQPELFAPRQHLRAEVGGHAKQTNRNGDCLQPVGHGKAAVKDAQRVRADLAGRGQLDQVGAGALAGGKGGQLPDRRLHGVFIGPGRQPQRQVVDAPVTRQAHKISLVNGDGAELAGVVAPHAGHKKPGRFGRYKCLRERRKKIARLGLVQLEHGLADINADGPGRHAQRLADQRQGAGRRLQFARNQRHGGLARLEQQLRHAQAARSRHARQCGHTLHKGRAEVGGVTGCGVAGGAHIQISRQHHIQPVRDRMPEAGHHDGQRHRQAERSHHPTDRHAGAFAHAPRTLHRQHGQRALRHQRAQAAVEQADQAGQGADAADQQQRHRHIGAQRDTGHRRQQRQQAAGRQQQPTQPRVTSAAHAGAQALEALRRRQLLRGPGRPPAAYHRCHHTQPAIDQRGRRAPLQAGRDAGKVAAAQVTAQEAQGQRRQCRPQGHTASTADQAQ